MAPSRAGPAVVAGSAPWIVQEKRRAMDVVMTEAQDFSFSVCRELEWLNEHMGGIFRPNLDINATFKTPARIRGKTPRTIRKQLQSAGRIPLSDIFAPNLVQSHGKLAQSKASGAFQIAHDPENAPKATNTLDKPLKPDNGSQFSDNASHAYKDSGYHGMTDDDMDQERRAQSQDAGASYTAPQPSKTRSMDVKTSTNDEGPRISNESFVTAKENVTSRFTSVEPSLEKHASGALVRPQSPSKQIQSAEPARAVENDDDNMELDELQSPSDGPSPVKALPRKSSLTFSSIPAREPLGKSSLGPRASHAEINKSFGPGINHSTLTSSIRPSVAGTTTSFPAIDSTTLTGSGTFQVQVESESSETLKLHNKTSTQRLHDRINMLGQAREVRPSKSFHTSSDKRLYPSLLVEDMQTASVIQDLPTSLSSQALSFTVADDDDEWILPLSKASNSNIATIPKVASQHHEQIIEEVANRLAGVISPKPQHVSPKRPFLHQKMASTTLLASPTKAAMAPSPPKPISVSNPPNLKSQTISTTPANSPPRSPTGRKMLDGPISASKAKLNSLLKSAKGIFASSAGASAQAKLETLSSEVQPHAGDLAHPFEKEVSTQKLPVEPKIEPRRTRSSTERDLKRKAAEQSKLSDDLERMRDKERQRAAAAAAAKMNRAPPAHKSTKPKYDEPLRSDPREDKDDVFHDASDDMPPPPPPKSMLPTTSLKMNQQVRRVPVPRPTQDSGARAKPAPVIIRMPSQRLGPSSQASVSSQTGSTASTSAHDVLPPPPPPKTAPANNSKTTGFTAHLNSSASSLKSTNPTAKRALDVAAKKKEQEMKIAQQKAEKKRELEQKRAQRIEEERKRDELRKAAEQQKLLEARKAAQRQAELKRMEMQRREPPRPESRLNTTASSARGDVGQIRPVSKMHVVHEPARHIVPGGSSKAVKRPRPLDNDTRGPDRPAVQRNPPSYQQLDAKRRKTDEQDVVEARVSIMAPPVRQSTVKKDVNKYTHGYTSTHTTPHHNQSMLIKTVTSQHHQQQQKSMQQSEMTKYASGRIPFAEASSQQATHVSQYTSQYKTPARPNPTATLSPYYTPGENIELPDIPSDSEDEDSENEFIAPSWTESPALREALRSQQLVDPESIFGPIAALNMEEVFRDNKDRLKKFRKRTSSANWNGVDRLTDSERKRDRDARERMEADGGWDFQSQRAAMYRKSPKPL